jgi:hypothetical protein
MYRKLRNSVDVTVCYDILSFVCTPWRWYFCAETCTSEVTNILQVHLVGTLHEDSVINVIIVSLSLVYSLLSPFVVRITAEFIMRVVALIVVLIYLSFVFKSVTVVVIEPGTLLIVRC